MQILSIINCNDYGLVETIYIIKNVLTFLRILIPVILIIFCMIEVVKAVMNDKLKLTKSLGQKLMAAAVIFLLPSVINVVMYIVEGVNLTSDTCWTNATRETVNELKEQARLEALQEEQDRIQNTTDENNSDYESGKDVEYGNGSSKIKNYIFVGDSRTEGMYLTVRGNTDAHFVYKTGEGLNWLKSTGVSTVNNLLKSEPSYIFVNLGVNDAGGKGNEAQAQNYINYYKQLARSDWKNEKIVIVAVGPKIGSGCYENANNESIQKFNELVKDGIKNTSNLYFCDAYHGFGVKNYKTDASCDVHYNSKTYQNLYDYIMENCKF